MFKKLIIATTALVGYAMAEGPLSSLGGVVADLNKGFCRAFQDNQADLTTACYVSCTDTEPMIEAFFNSVNFTNTNDMVNTF